MTKTPSPGQLSFPFSRISFFLWLSGFESLIAAGFLVALPSESGGFLGLSPIRLAVLVATLLPGMFFFVAAISRIKHPQGLLQLHFNIRHASWLIPGCLAVGAVCVTSIALLQDLYVGTGVYLYLAYAERLAPMLVYFAILAMQTAGILIWLHLGKIRQVLMAEKPFLVSWGFVFGGLILLVILIAVTRLGLVPDPIGWGKPTVPLLEWQIWLGVLVCMFFRLSQNNPLFVKAAAWKIKHPAAAGWLISLFIWILAMSVWVGQAVPPGFFATPPRAPNFEIYPFSDAAFYDFHSQSLLIGLGFRGEAIPPRPLYILFLAFAHLLAGQEYTRVIFIQTAVLAFFPVIIYWIGKKLSTATTGFIAAIFIILREWTSIVSTPFTSDVSNSKLLFADLPAALAICLVLLVSIHWLQKPKGMVSALLTGGLLGISLLIRTQIVILLPVVLVFYTLLAFKNKIAFRSMVIPLLLFLAGFMLAVSPWLSRSYHITGQFVFDHPESQTRVVAQRFHPDTELTDFDRKPDETTGEYNQRLSTLIREKILSDPGSIIQFVSAHWLNSEISNLLIFPVRFSITGLDELVKPQHAFWEEWDGQSTPRQTAVMMLNLAVLAAGFVLLTGKNSWTGLLPLAFNLAYHFSNAAARNSGWRYLLPTDWIFPVYFAAGITAIVSFGSAQEQFPQEEREEITRRKKRSLAVGLAALGLGIFCIGYLPLAAESMFPRLYPPATIENTQNIITSSTLGYSTEIQEGVKQLITDPDVIVMHGRMLYPRFYAEKEGEENTGKTGYTPLPYARYVFLVAGDPDGTVIFPQTRSDLPLRNTDDIILIGCMDGLAVRARMVILPGDPSTSYLANPPDPWRCDRQP
jgi:hypothetical protein